MELSNERSRLFVFVKVSTSDYDSLRIIIASNILILSPMLLYLSSKSLIGKGVIKTIDKNNYGEEEDTGDVIVPEEEL